MEAWRRVSLVGRNGALRAPGQLVEELRGESTGVLLADHAFGRIRTYASLLCRHLATLSRPWAVEADLALADDPALLRTARRSGCRTVLIGPEPDPLTGEAAARLRAIRRAGLLTVVRLTIGRPGDDAGVFGRAVRLCVAGRVAFPQLLPAAGMAEDELTRGLAWARRALHRHGSIWRRAGILERRGLAVLVASYRDRRVLRAEPVLEPTPAMRLARALARPIRIRERVPFVSTLVGAVQAGGGQVRHARLWARAGRDDTLAALVIRLEGAVDARAARKLVGRVQRALRGTRERIVVDLAGVELVSLTVLTRFLEEHAGRLVELRGRLAFRNLRPALAALRGNLHGMLPNAALLEQALEEAT
jgi:anti-anti-sigma regulatory factor